MKTKSGTTVMVGLFALVLLAGSAWGTDAPPSPMSPDGDAQGESSVAEQTLDTPAVAHSPDKTSVRLSPAPKRGPSASGTTAGVRPPMATPDLQIQNLPKVGGGVGRTAFTTVVDWYVDDTGPSCPGTGAGTQADPYCTIGEALTAASAGDTIHVALGTYAETLAIGTGFNNGTIIGEFGSKPFVTGGMTLAAGVDGVTVENLYFTGAGASSSVIRMLGGVHNLTLNRCTIDGELTSGRHGFSGGQLEDDATITNCEFKDVLGWALFESRSGSGGGGSPLGTILFADNYIHNCNGTVVFRGDETNPPTSWTDEVIISGNRWQTIGGNGAETGSQWAAFEVNRAEVATICKNRVDDVNIGLGGEGEAAQLWSIDVLNVHDNTFTNNDEGIWVADVDSILATSISINNNVLVGNTAYAIKFAPGAISGDLDAEDNWWGTTVGATIGAMMAGAGTVDYTPWLAISQIQLLSGGNRLVGLQQNDGGWDWPLDDGDPNNASPLNTIGPIGRGLARAYQETGDAAMFAALQNVATLLQTKTNNFSPSDGYLAAELDRILGGTANVDHVVANFYDPLAGGTYDRNGLGTLYTTASYVLLIRDARASSGIPNLAAWDIGMGLVGAASAGANTSAWIAGVKAEIDELDKDVNGNGWFDVIGLAGAVYGLAFVAEDFDPTSGEHAAASDLGDLADILVSYQIVESGGFTWNANYVIANDFNETIQETSYSVLALLTMGGYSSAVLAAVDYINSVQLCTGGWKNWAGGGENNEVTAEALWASGLPVKNLDTTELFATIQEAIDDADTMAGDTIEIQTAVHFEGQVVVDKDLTLQGGSVDTIKMTEDTGSSGDSRGWFLVEPGVTLVVSDIIFDGNGHLVYQGFRTRGNGSFTNCTFRDIKFNESGPTYAGLAVVAFGGAGNPVDITNCVFEEIGRVGVLYFGTGVNGSAYDGNRYTGKGSGDWLDYALDISAGAVVTVSDSTITQCRGVASSDGSTSAGVLVTTFFGAGTTATITGSTITHNTTGIVVGFQLADTPTTVVANGNFIYNNGLSTGIGTVSAGVTDATGNWWGHATGPNDPDNDLGETDDIGGNLANCGTPATDYNTGSGDGVFDTTTEVVDYCSWLDTFQRLALLAVDCQDDTDGGESGHQIEVELWMLDLASDATGFQAFVEYNTAVLSFRGDLSSYPTDPFDLHFGGPISGAEDGHSGLLDLDGATDPGVPQPPTSADSLLATLVFDVLNECGNEVVNFEVGGAFPSELSFEGTPLATGLADTAAFNLDDTDPTATGPDKSDLECSTDLPAAATTIAAFLALTGGDADDNCTDQADLSVSSSDGSLVGDECSGTITRTYTITDDCNNSTDVDHVFNVSDDTNPVIGSCPANQDVNADAGVCTAVVTFSTPTATDNCDLTPVVTCDWPSGSTFPTGATLVTCTAVDDCLNEDSCTFTVTVNPVNDVDVDIQLVGVNIATTRCIHFVTDECGVTADVDLSFDSSGFFSGIVEIPCGSWTQLCAKDEQHTLFDTTAINVVGTIYEAGTTLDLEGGDTDNDSDVDIHDVTLLLAQFGDLASDGGCPWDSTRDADFSNNGAVGTEDYTFLTDNWLTSSSCACTIGLNGPDDPGSSLLASISVTELPADLARWADFNADGVVDYKDVREFERRNGLPNDLSSVMEASNRKDR